MIFTETPNQLRSKASELERRANSIEAERISIDAKFIVVENMQDGRPRASGPFTFDDASKIVSLSRKRFICDYGPLLP